MRGWDTELGRRALEGKHSLALLYERQPPGRADPVTGRQEHLENVVARHVERALEGAPAPLRAGRESASGQWTGRARR